MSAKKAKAKHEALSCFVLDFPNHPDIRYMRYYWKNDGHQTGIKAAVLNKLTPAGHSAARSDVLLPEAAPGEYASLAHLLERYDSTKPLTERTGYVQFNIYLPPERPIHAGWEKIRSWAMSYFVQKLQMAAILVLHAPYQAGSGNASHVHVIIPGRRVAANGFAQTARDVCSDAGAADAIAHWRSFTSEALA